MEWNWGNSAALCVRGIATETALWKVLTAKSSAAILTGIAHFSTSGPRKTSRREPNQNRE